MSNFLAYSQKAEQYAKYRWDYAIPAIERIFDVAHVGATTHMADTGSGTGILTRHFVQQVEYIAGIEPNATMRQWAERNLSRYLSFHSIDAQAEYTPLPDHSMDLIVIGQAIHWFSPSLARPELLRILKPAGWLAVLWNHPTDQQLGQALRSVCIAENGWALADSDKQPKPVDLDFYYGNQTYTRHEYPVTQTQSWEQFFGALCSDSHAPDDGHRLFKQFEAAAQQVFKEFSSTDQVISTYATILNIGRML